MKKSREMEERFMLFEEMLNDERREGKTEGKMEGTAENVMELLEDIGTLSEELREKIMEETDLFKLKKWLKLAAKAESIEQFMSEM